MSHSDSPVQISYFLEDTKSQSGEVFFGFELGHHGDIGGIFGQGHADVEIKGFVVFFGDDHPDPVLGVKNMFSVKAGAVPYLLDVSEVPRFLEGFREPTLQRLIAFGLEGQSHMVILPRLLTL